MEKYSSNINLLKIVLISLIIYRILHCTEEPTSLILVSDSSYDSDSGRISKNNNNILVFYRQIEPHQYGTTYKYYMKEYDKFGDIVSLRTLNVVNAEYGGSPFVNLVHLKDDIHALVQISGWIFINGATSRGKEIIEYMYDMSYLYLPNEFITFCIEKYGVNAYDITFEKYNLVGESKEKSIVDLEGLKFSEHSFYWQQPPILLRNGNSVFCYEVHSFHECYLVETQNFTSIRNLNHTKKICSLYSLTAFNDGLLCLSVMVNSNFYVSELDENGFLINKKNYSIVNPAMGSLGFYFLYALKDRGFLIIFKFYSAVVAKRFDCNLKPVGEQFLVCSFEDGRSVNGVNVIEFEGGIAFLIYSEYHSREEQIHIKIFPSDYQKKENPKCKDLKYKFDLFELEEKRNQKEKEIELAKDSFSIFLIFFIPFILIIIFIIFIGLLVYFIINYSNINKKKTANKDKLNLEVVELNNSTEDENSKLVENNNNNNSDFQDFNSEINQTKKVQSTNLNNNNKKDNQILTDINNNEDDFSAIY